MTAASSSPNGNGVEGDLAYRIFSFNAHDDTAISIVTGFRNILHVDFQNKTDKSHGVVDWTTTNGTVAITGLSSNDVGSIKVYAAAG